MKKLILVVAALALTTLAGVSSEARSLKTFCTKPIQCPHLPNCQNLGCINNTCEYDCEPFSINP
jgi:hypothetical protein